MEPDTSFSRAKFQRSRRQAAIALAIDRRSDSGIGPGE
jgi:hypothetical protein